jgi:hypothetical protein
MEATWVSEASSCSNRQTFLDPNSLIKTLEKGGEKRNAGEGEILVMFRHRGEFVEVDVEDEEDEDKNKYEKEKSRTSTLIAAAAFCCFLSFTFAHLPISSGVAGPMRTNAVAPTVAHRRRMSHLEGVLITIMPYLID